MAINSTALECCCQQSQERNIHKTYRHHNRTQTPGLYYAEELLTEEEVEGISTAPEAVMEYTAQLLAVMQGKAESRGGVAVLGESSTPPLRVLAC